MPVSTQARNHPVLRVDDLRVSIAGRPILHDVSLEIRAGEIVVLCGPNGAGKSTLVRCISGQQPIEGGRTRIAGADPRTSPQSRRMIGYVPQQIALYERLTPRENLAAFGALMGLPRREIVPRVRELLATVGLSDRGDDQVRFLSGGMRRRVHIAVALMHRPRLLILDEPSAGLDFQSRLLVAGMLRQIRRESVAILLITHDVEEAELLADRIGVLIAGRMRTFGPPAEVLGRTFGGRQEVRIVRPRSVGVYLPGRIATAMTAAGLSPDGANDAWTGLVRLSDRNLQDILAEVASGRLLADEVAIRSPRLESLMAHCLAEAGGRR